MPSWLCKIWRFYANLLGKIVDFILDVVKKIVGFVVEAIESVGKALFSGGWLWLLGAGVLAYFVLTSDSSEDEVVVHEPQTRPTGVQ